MNTTHAMFGVVLAVAVAGGCDKKPEPKIGAGRPSAAEYNAMMEQARTAARDASAKAAQAATQRAAAGTQASAADVKLLEQAAAVAANDAKARGAELLGKLDAAIKDRKLDEARTYADAFDKIKESVPAELKTRYESLKAHYQAAKDKAATPPPAAPTPPPAEPNK